MRFIALIFVVTFIVFHQSGAAKIESSQLDELIGKNMLLTSHEVKGPSGEIQIVSDLVARGSRPKREFVNPQGDSAPTMEPTEEPSEEPSEEPTEAPTAYPTSQPSSHPSSRPSSRPSRRPSAGPSTRPSSRPSTRPSSRPSTGPSSRPSTRPSSRPSTGPSSRPSSVPTARPTSRPTTKPTAQPTSRPSSVPSSIPSSAPSSKPTSKPSSVPTSVPTSRPTSRPSSIPSSAPTSQPTSLPSGLPSGQPSALPSGLPTSQPSSLPTGQPSSVPSSQPSGWPSGQPTGQPTAPSFRPTFQPYSPTNKPTRLVTEVVTVNANYTFDSVFALELNNVSIATITAAILQTSPPNANIEIVRIYRVAISDDRRMLDIQMDKIRELAISYSYAAIVKLLFNLIDFPGLNATAVATKQAAFIREVGLNGTFQSVLRQLALANNASQLFNTTIRDVEIVHTVFTPPTFAPTKAPRPTRTARLTDGQVAGLVIGTVIGTSCLFAILYMFIVNKRKNDKYVVTGNYNGMEPSEALQGGYFGDDMITINLGDETSQKIAPVPKSQGGGGQVVTQDNTRVVAL